MNWKSSDKYLKRLIKESGGGGSEGSVDLYVHNIYIDGSNIPNSEIPYINLCFITKDELVYTWNKLITLFEQAGNSSFVCSGYVMYLSAPTPIIGPILKCSYFDDSSGSGLEINFIINFDSENMRTTRIYSNDFYMLDISDNVMPMVNV